MLCHCLKLGYSDSMYFIINKTRNPVVIGDLNFELKPKQAIDLEMILARHQIEESKNLKAAVAQGIISVRQETRKKRENPSGPVDDPTVEINKLKKEIRSEIKDQMSEIADAIRESRPAAAEPVEQPSQQELLGALSKLTEVMKSVGINVQDASAGGVLQAGLADSIVEDIDPAIAKKIHAKAVDKMTEGLKSKVKYEEKKSSSNLIDDRADELDKLMGG